MPMNPQNLKSLKVTETTPAALVSTTESDKFILDLSKEINML
jgi:hypothetical protein